MCLLIMRVKKVSYQVSVFRILHATDTRIDTRWGFSIITEAKRQQLARSPAEEAARKLWTHVYVPTRDMNLC